jgi:protein-tyrosine phosphatase
MAFFSSKPLLKNLIPNNYIDIHSHLLPGIDNGAKNIEETQFLIKEMNSFGIKNFITTPHIMTNVWDNDSESIQKKLFETINLIDCSLYESFNVSAEYMLDSYFLNRLTKEKLLPIKDNYILVEMSYLNPPMHLYEILFEIQLAGYKPILAHPERYLFYTKNLKEFEKLKNSGCLFQLNLLSTVNYYGLNITKTADFLIANDYVDFVGSDIHHKNHIEAFSQKIKIKNYSKLEKVIKNNLFFLP